MQGLSIDEGQPPASGFETMVELEKIRPTLESIEGDIKKVNDQLSGEKKTPSNNSKALCTSLSLLLRSIWMSARFTILVMFIQRWE